MAGIRQRKKNLILAALSGAALTGIPLSGAAIFFSLESIAVRQQVEIYEAKEENQNTYVIYVLNKKKLRGEMITKEDITPVEVSGDKPVGQRPVYRNLVGKQMRITADAGTVLSESLLAAEELPQDDQRKLELDYIRIPEMLQEGELIDVRIRFANGEDYIIAAKKTVLALQRQDDYGTVNLLELQVGEEEILKLASAEADQEKYENTMIYAVTYTEDGQMEAEHTYPVNPSVYELSTWDPNTGKRVLTLRNLEKRTILEANLETFFQKE